MGDYAAAIGTTGFDFTVLQRLTPLLTVTVPPTGAMVQETGLRAIDLTDGLSHTLMVGEKHIPVLGELTYPHDCSLYDGHNIICSTRNAGPGFPLARARDDPRVLFGSAHIGVVQFAFADGGVRPVRTSIDEYVLGLLSHRGDGQVQPADY